MTLAIALLLAAALVLTSLLFQVYRRRWRRRRLAGLELRPNCLLTRYPIAFLSGRKTLFRFFDHWNDVPTYLREHGYEVLLIEPSPRSARLPSLLAALKTMDRKCHLIADSSLEAELRAIARAKPPQIESLTLIQSAKRAAAHHAPNRPATVAELRPLDAAVEIFEVPSSIDQARASVPWINAISRTLLMAHNWLLFGRTPPIDPIETAEFVSHSGWNLESCFLDLAISLAERDTQWSD